MIHVVLLVLIRAAEDQTLSVTTADGRKVLLRVNLNELLVQIIYLDVK